MNGTDNEFDVLWEASEEGEFLDFDELERKLESDLEEQFSDLEFLEEDREKIGDPEYIGTAVMNVVWDQFINQVGVVAGQEFIEENRGLTLDLRKEAHIQTTENFAEGKIATHNTRIDYQKRYDDWQSSFVKDARGNVVMHDTRVYAKDANGNIIIGSDGKPVKQQVATITKEARKVYDAERNRRGLTGNVQKGTDMDETISVAEIIRDPSANAHMTLEERIEFDLSKENLNEIDASWNRSKSDTPTDQWLDSPNSNGQKPQEALDNMTDEDVDKLRQKNAESRGEFKKRKEDAEKRSVEAGKQSQKEEAFRIGGKALRAVLMGLLTELIRNIIQKLVSWIRSGEKSFKSFIAQMKEAILSFVANLKQNVLTAGNTLATTIATSIIGPVVGMVKKVWLAIKQGARSIKEAIQYIKNPENRKKPFGILALEVGKIIVAGLAAVGSLVLSEVIEKSLMAIPAFAAPIPMLGSLANILGMFFGAVVSGIAGALILNLIDKMLAKKNKDNNMEQQIEKKNEIMATQDKLMSVKIQQLEETIKAGSISIMARQKLAGEIISEALTTIFQEDDDDSECLINEDLIKSNDDLLDSLLL